MLWQIPFDKHPLALPLYCVQYLKPTDSDKGDKVLVCLADVQFGHVFPKVRRDLCGRRQLSSPSHRGKN